MNKLIIAGSVLTLAGCASLPFPQPNSASQVIADVQAETAKICAVITDANAIAILLGVNDPLLLTADEIAKAVCAAVAASSPLSHRRLGATHSITIDGVVIPYK